MESAVSGITPVTGNTFTVNPTLRWYVLFVITDSYTPTCLVTTNSVEVIHNQLRQRSQR
jgi:hypothetical protein